MDSGGLGAGSLGSKPLAGCLGLTTPTPVIVLFYGDQGGIGGGTIGGVAIAGTTDQLVDGVLAVSTAALTLTFSAITVATASPMWTSEDVDTTGAWTSEDPMEA